MSAPTPLYLAVALDGAGWHPAAWREPHARPAELFGAPYWADLVQEAEAGLLDFVTIEDALGLQPTAGGGPANAEVRGRLDAVLIASRVAPVTSSIGIVPTATVTHTEPFHVSKAIATLDYVSEGRAGWRAQISGRPEESRHFGRRALQAIDPRTQTENPALTALFDEAGEVVEVVRRLWDSWEDDAEIRDAATGRFIDREKLHYIDFQGEYFSVKGPSIVPRPPQGQPLVTALAHIDTAYRFAARHADVAFVTPHDRSDIDGITTVLHAERARARPDAEPLLVFGDLVVFLDEGAGAARDRLARLDDTAGAAYTSDARIFAGTAAELADLLLSWQPAGLHGFRLRPGALPDDLNAITRALVPELQRRGAFRTSYEATSLRGNLGLGRPENRYAATSSTASQTAQGVPA